MAKHEPPKDGLVRAARPGLEVRAAEDNNKMPTLHGYFIRFDEPTEIDSLFEGRFIERIAPGAAKKTLQENRDGIKILFNHGHDPSIGEKPLAKPELKEDDTGVHYEGELFDTSYNRDLVPALESGQLGASFKFRSVKESFDEEPEPSDSNPEGIPERTIEELKLYEGGPVVFPAYEGASAGVRSMTDHLFVERAKQEPGRVPELVELFEEWIAQNPERAQEILDRAVTDSAWDGSSRRFDDDQWKRACLLDREDCEDTSELTAKQRYSLPVREPDGTLSRKGCHAAAGRIGQVDACPKAKEAAAKKLVSLYRDELNEEPSEALLSLAGEKSASADPAAEGRTNGAGADHSTATTKGRLYGDAVAPSWRL